MPALKIQILRVGIPSNVKQIEVASSHDHADLIPLRWLINDLGNLLPPTRDEWCDYLNEPLPQGLQFSP